MNDLTEPCGNCGLAKRDHEGTGYTNCPKPFGGTFRQAFTIQATIKNMQQLEPTQEEIERSFNEAANQLISNAAVRARYVRKEKYEAVLKSLGELIKIADYYHDREVTYTDMPYKNWTAAIDRAKKLIAENRE